MRRSFLSPSLLALALAAVPAACSSRDSSPAQPLPANDAAVDANGADTAPEAWDAIAPDAESDGSADAAPDAEPDAGPPPPPTADSIQFKVLAPLPQGEQLLFNEWGASPNKLFSMTPDGAVTTPVLQALRIWSFGVSHDASRIAFSCADPDQQAHFGITMGDAIQHTWLFDTATQVPELLAYGNLNDECHVFGPGDTTLYVCRRYDFDDLGHFKGWRIGKIDPSTKDFAFLTPDLPNTYDLFPQPLPDGISLLFGRIELQGTKQNPSVLQMSLPDGTPTTLRTDGGRPALSPDGTRYVYQNSADAHTLYSSKLDGTDPVKVTNAQASEPAWSPDGASIAYLVWDNAAGCSHLDVVASDGSEAAAPKRLRDCSLTGDFMTQLAWVVRP